MRTNRTNDLEATGDSALEKAEMRQRGQNFDLGGVLAEQFDGANAVRIEMVVNVLGEVMTNGCGRDRNARCPFFDEIFYVGEAVIA